jgi:L-arabinose isomerase
MAHHWALGTGRRLPELRAISELTGLELIEVAVTSTDD